MTQPSAQDPEPGASPASGQVPGARPARPRRPRDRARTEADLLAAAIRLIERDGVLAGLNLAKVADEAGVNRGQIYRFYGTRQALARAALEEVVRRWQQAEPSHFTLGFAERRKEMFRLAVQYPAVPRIMAMLVLDGDDEVHPMPTFAHSRQALARDQRTGELRPDVDAQAWHVLAVAARLGYAVFRDALARDAGIPLDELDRRVGAAHDDLVDGLASPSHRQVPRGHARAEPAASPAPEGDDGPG